MCWNVNRHKTQLGKNWANQKYSCLHDVQYVDSSKYVKTKKKNRQTNTRVVCFFSFRRLSSGLWWFYLFGVYFQIFWLRRGRNQMCASDLVAHQASAKQKRAKNQKKIHRRNYRPKRNVVRPNRTRSKINSYTIRSIVVAVFCMENIFRVNFLASTRRIFHLC